jgi:alpha-L-fucosidase
VGRSLIAHLYNDNSSRHGGKEEVVYTCKQKSEGRWVEDLERGVMPGINPYPWQTDTSIGDWFYNRNWKFRPVSWTIHMLVDIVSKNGNLLLNVVQRPDGSLDPEVEQMLYQMVAWIKVNGEAIYDTRPWEVYGEGLVSTKGGHFKEDFAYSSKDVRFTTKGKTLYAVALGWPQDGQLLVKSLGNRGDEKVNRIHTVQLLGHKGNLTFTQNADGLKVTLPSEKLSDLTCALKIEGADLHPVALPQPLPER